MATAIVDSLEKEPQPYVPPTDKLLFPKLETCSDCGQDTADGFCMNCHMGETACGELELNQFKVKTLPAQPIQKTENEYPLMLVGLGGLKGAGKNVVAEMLRRAFGFRVVAFADSLKLACKVIFGFTTEQLHGSQASKEAIDPYWGKSPRWIMQRVGTEAMRKNVLDDVWVRALERQLTAGRFAVADVRFPNEADMIRRLGGEVWLVQREKPLTRWGRIWLRIRYLLGYVHESEMMAQSPELFDRVIPNHSTLDALLAHVELAAAKMAEKRAMAALSKEKEGK
jgi:predicted kinase